jgi:hypothetical protein
MTTKLMSRKGNKQSAVEAMQNQTRPTQAAAPDRGNGSSGNGGGPENSANGSMASQFNSDEIAQRAYQIFEREGRMDGRDMDHWLQAERELRLERERTGGANPENAQNAPRSARQHQRT